MITAGLVAGSLSGWQPLPIGFVIFGAGLILLGLSFSGQTAGSFWQQRSTQVGTNATISVLALLIILGLVNFLGVKYSARLDLTETQLYTLAPASQKITSELNRPVRLVIFDTVQNPQDVELLEGYRRLSNQFSYDYIDPFADPIAAQTFGISQPGAVFLEVGEDRRFLQTVGDPSNPQTLGTPEALSERQLTNALARIVSDRTLTVYFVQGHEEYPIEPPESGLQQAISSLEEKSYVVNPLDLTEAQSVPEDASVVVVAGPAQDFFAAEVDALTDYLAAGGGVLLMLDPRADAGLNSLLDDWGILLDDRLVLDLSGAGQFAELGPAALIVTDYGEHPITQEFGNRRSFFPIARPIETRDLPGINSTPLFLSNAQSRAESISDEGNLAFDPEALPDGPYVLGTALNRPVETESSDTNTEDSDTEATDTNAETDPDSTEAEDPALQAEEARLVIIGNSAFATDGTFEQQLNGDVFLNAISWLGREDDATLSIRPKTVTNRRIVMSAQQAFGLGLFALLILPLTGLALAIVMALRRR